MKKTALFLSVGLFALTACSSRTSASKTDIAVGGDVDEHGCLPAAGYSWSALQQRCLQLFNDALRLNPVVETPAGNATYNAFVLFNEDKSKAEIFVPKKGDHILAQSEEGVYQKQSYEYRSKDQTLLINGKPEYKAD